MRLFSQSTCMLFLLRVIIIYSMLYSQVTFIDFIVYPLWETWAELVYPAGQLMLDNIGKTREYWNAMIDPNSPPPSSDDQEQDSSCDTDSTDRISSQERAVEHREGNIVTFKTLKDEIENQERRTSNGPTSSDGERVNERATCITSSSELSSSVDPLFLSSDSRRRSSEISEITRTPLMWTLGHACAWVSNLNTGV